MNLTLGDTRLIIDACKKQGLSRSQCAYVLATAYHETAHTMTPVREYGGETYLRKKPYYPYVGMGYVQLTWKANYERASNELGYDFVANPKALLQPKYAAPILILGMSEGWFTGKKLSDYIGGNGADFLHARRIVNGLDKADLIAGYAKDYVLLLNADGYGLSAPPAPVPPPSPAPEPVVVPSPPVVVPVATAPSFWASLFSAIGKLFGK